jgi:hypothetical protein
MPSILPGAAIMETPEAKIRAVSYLMFGARIFTLHSFADLHSRDQPRAVERSAATQRATRHWSAKWSTCVACSSTEGAVCASDRVTATLGTVTQLEISSMFVRHAHPAVLLRCDSPAQVWPLRCVVITAGQLLRSGTWAEFTMPLSYRTAVCLLTA